MNPTLHRAFLPYSVDHQWILEGKKDTDQHNQCCLFNNKDLHPLQCSCLENPRDGGAWWAAIYGVAQSRTRLRRLSSSSSSMHSDTCSTCHFLPVTMQQEWRFLPVLTGRDKWRQRVWTAGKVIFPTSTFLPPSLPIWNLRCSIHEKPCLLSLATS